MRILNGVLCAILLLFVAVQVNDPDGPLWMAIYGAGALWAAIAALRPAALSRSPLRPLLALTLLAAIGGLVWYWPDTPGWWRQDVWWETETAREGMGMMVLLAALMTASVSALFRARGR